MPNIAMIGAGSSVFSKTLIMDILATEALNDSTFALMSPTESKLKRLEAFTRRVIKDNGLSAHVQATTDRRAALTGADFVISSIAVGGFAAWEKDRNSRQTKINWQFTTDDARIKLRHLYLKL